METTQKELLKIITERDEQIADLEKQVGDLTNIIGCAIGTLSSAVTLREPEPGENIKLEDLNLTSRPFNACRLMGIKTARDLTRYTKKELSRWRNLGVSSLRQIETALAEHGLKFKPEI